MIPRSHFLICRFFNSIVYFAASDIDWIDSKTLIFSSKEEAEDFRSQFIWEKDSWIENIENMNHGKDL